MKMTDRKQHDINILVIDDEPDIVEFLEILLGSKGFSVLGASSGADGLRIAQEERIDLVLLDIRMAEIDGHEVCKRLRHNPATQKTPIIALTAADRVTELTLCACEGVTGFMAKPFDNRSLVDAVFRILEPESVPPVFSRAMDGGLISFDASLSFQDGRITVCLHVIETQVIPFIRSKEPMDGVRMLGLAEHGVSESNRRLTQILVEIRDSDSFKGFLENIYAEGGNVAYCRMFEDVGDIPSSIIGELTSKA